MSAPRKIFPVVPTRWIRARRGPAVRNLQHVVATRGFPWSTPTLCGAEIGSGAYRSSGGQLGPKTQRPLVTVRPDETHPVCDKCSARLEALR